MHVASSSLAYQTNGVVVKQVKATFSDKECFARRSQSRDVRV